MFGAFIPTEATAPALRSLKGETRHFAAGFVIRATGLEPVVPAWDTAASKLQSRRTIKVEGEDEVGAVTTAVLWGTEGAPFSIGYDEPMWEGDSGLTILLEDAPDPEDVGPDDPRVGLAHLDCVVDEFPGIGLGLALAREYGCAELDLEGVWVAAPFDDA